jgi:hypothetical protein
MTTNGEHCPIQGHEYEPATACRACAADRAAGDAPPVPGRLLADDGTRTAALRAAVAPRSAPNRWATPPVAEPGAQPLRCPRCRPETAYLESNEGKESHNTVFGHYPPTSEGTPRES